MLKNKFIASVLTLSDKGAIGEREDQSGPIIKQYLEENGYIVESYKVISDEEELIYEELVRIADVEKVDVIFTTGGTGLSPRDNTPEATLRAATKNVPGIAEAIRSYSMTITKRAMLSRGVSVMRNQTLIINLPGSPKAVRETLEYLLPELEHGILIMSGKTGECARK